MNLVLNTSGRDAEMLEAPEENDHRGLSPSDVAIMPRDLAAPVSRENAAFVHEKTRRALLSKLEQARHANAVGVKSSQSLGNCFLPP
jgi:hypothetical protein